MAPNADRPGDQGDVRQARRTSTLVDSRRAGRRSRRRGSGVGRSAGCSARLGWSSLLQRGDGGAAGPAEKCARGPPLIELARHANLRRIYQHRRDVSRLFVPWSMASSRAADFRCSPLRRCTAVAAHDRLGVGVAARHESRRANTTTVPAMLAWLSLLSPAPLFLRGHVLPLTVEVSHDQVAR